MGDEQYVAHEPGPVKMRRVDRYSTRAVCPYCGSHVYLNDDELDYNDEPIVRLQEDGTLLLFCSECDESFRGLP